MASPVRQRLDFALLYLLFLLVRPLPRRWLPAVGGVLGDFVFSAIRFRRAVVLANLKDSFGAEMGPDELRALARAFYRNLGMTLLEFLAFPRLQPGDLEELVEVRGVENLEKVLENGRGGLLVSGHFGNWEYLAARLAAGGFKVDYIVKSQANPRVDRIQNDIRRRAGIGIIRSGAAIKEMILALRQGGFIGLLADQDAGKDGIFCEFLGRPASVFRGTAYLAWKLKCPIVTGYILRQAQGRHVMIIEPPVHPDPDWDEATAIRELTRIHVQRLEAAIRMAPDHYYWLHRRWKTRPPEGWN